MATVHNRIQDDAAYSKTYPQMTGRGAPATQEVHIFLEALNPDTETLERYYSAVKEWNEAHPDLTNKMKPVYLALLFRDPKTGEENTVSVMQSARYVRSDDAAFVVQQAHEDADWFAKKGLSVIREKIEATAYGIDGIPNSAQEVRRYASKYFEFHFKVSRKDHCNKEELTEKELDELKSISKKFSKKFNIPIPLSYNRNADKIGKDGKGYQRFLNARFRRMKLDAVKERIKEIESAIHASKEFRLVKTISEYVWYDSYRELDEGWIDFRKTEKRGKRAG